MGWKLEKLKKKFEAAGYDASRVFAGLHLDATAASLGCNGNCREQPAGQRRNHVLRVVCTSEKKVRGCAAKDCVALHEAFLLFLIFFNFLDIWSRFPYGPSPREKRGGRLAAAHSRAVVTVVDSAFDGVGGRRPNES